ncbi:MAG: 30S ribosomal protein S16 [Bacilli bacterium]|jgi:small subunit ribosomal protein S16|nr:30S ribosomal protein S16 [Bacilli bacterium]MCH3966567.1 30S ribosomal protein S16 [Bacilli bacterium]
MVKIRLARIGRKNLPSYRIVVSDSRRTPKSEAIADLGYFDPVHNKVQVNEEEAMKWLRTGAAPSDTVKSIFKKAGLNKKLAEEKAK